MNTQAIDKKLRRKARRECRQQGVHCPDLVVAQRIANRKFSKVNELNKEIDSGSANQKVAARKAKREMNTVWIKSGRDAYCDVRATPKAVKDAVIKSMAENV